MATTPEPYKRFGQWWYPRTQPMTGETKPHGPFSSRDEAMTEMTMNASQVEHAMPIPAPDWDVTSDPDVAMGVLRIDTPKQVIWYTLPDQVDQLLDGYHPADATYSVTFTAEIDGDTGSSTMREEISLAELQAFRAILALRPR